MHRVLLQTSSAKSRFGPRVSGEFTRLPSAHTSLPTCPAAARSSIPSLSPASSFSALYPSSHGVGLASSVVPVESAHISSTPPDLWPVGCCVLPSEQQAPAAAPGSDRMDAAMHPAGADDGVLAELLTGSEGTICGMPDFKMGGKRGDESAPTDAGDEDGEDDDGDEDGDFAEGEEEISEGEEYDNPKASDAKKKQIGEGEENGEDDEEEQEEQEGGGGDDDDDDDDDDNEDDDDDDDDVAAEDDEDGVEEEDDDQDDDEDDDDEDSLQPPKKRKK